MVNYLAKLAALAAVFPAIFAAPTATPLHLKVRNADLDARDVVPGSYLVIYKDTVTPEFRESHLEEVSSLLSLSKRDGSGIGPQFDLSTLKGFQVIADIDTLNKIADHDEVDYVEQDQIVTASALTTQSGATYGLGRISHRAPGSTSYIYDTTAGQGVNVYVIDTGIQINHAQFGGRASWGANFIDSSNTDGNGHGTHVAGTVGGSTYGVAKRANLIAVKVLNAAGSGTSTSVISGIQWVAQNAPPRSVINLSLGSPFSSASNSAARAAYNAGVTVVVAAGNSNANAANYSPASESTAITVGAIDSNDARASFSNYGTPLDVFAPGVNTLSAWIGSTTATRSISGTSMASPHVAGLAAYLIALEGLSSPAAVASRIVALSTTGRVSNPGSGSVNRIAYNGNGA